FTTRRSSDLSTAHNLAASLSNAPVEVAESYRASPPAGQSALESAAAPRLAAAEPYAIAALHQDRLHPPSQPVCRSHSPNLQVHYPRPRARAPQILPHHGCLHAPQPQQSDLPEPNLRQHL